MIREATEIGLDRMGVVQNAWSWKMKWATFHEGKACTMAGPKNGTTQGTHICSLPIRESASACEVQLIVIIIAGFLGRHKNFVFCFFYLSYYL